MVEAKTKRAITFEFHEAPAQEEQVDDVELEKRRQRAEKYGTQAAPDTAPPRAPKKYVARRDSARKAPHATHSAFVAGFEVFSAEESAKRAARAERFQLAPEPDLTEGMQLRVVKPTEEQLALRAELKSRAERFGIEYQHDDTGLMDIDLLEQRKEVDRAVDRRPDTIHVYGVDLMSTRDVKAYFRQFKPTFVEWINDSSCNVRFVDTVWACRAILELGEALPASEAPDQGGLGIEDVDISQAAFMWHRSHTLFQKGGVDIPLIFRIATVLDVKDPSAHERSRYLWKSNAPSSHARPQKRAREDSDGDAVMEQAVQQSELT